MKRSSLSVFRRSVNKTFLSTHAEKATSNGSTGNHQKKFVGTRTAGSFEHTTPIPKSEKTQFLLDLEEKTLAKNYHNTIPVVIQRGKGVHVFDVDDRPYLDFLAAYSAVNQGHCHPRLVNAMVDQASQLTLTSRAFKSDLLPQFSNMITKLLGYERVLPMNTGVEAGEVAVKLARKWAYQVKGVPKDQAKVVLAKNNFWGRSLAAVSSSTDPEAYTNYGPLLEGFQLINFNDLEALESAISDPNTAAFMVEPIQGEGGVVVPASNYLNEARRLCTKYNVLLICDEVQTGLCRTGKMLAVNHNDIKPDILCLGKALSGGMLPVSCILADTVVMTQIKPGQHGSTYGGNPMACRIAMEALSILVEENLAENSRIQGERFRKEIEGFNSPLIREVRGLGLMNALVLNLDKNQTWDVTMELAANGLLCKPTKDNILRLSPPLTINDNEMSQALDIMRRVLC